MNNVDESIKLNRDTTKFAVNQKWDGKGLSWIMVEKLQTKGHFEGKIRWLICLMMSGLLAQCLEFSILVEWIPQIGLLEAEELNNEETEKVVKNPFIQQIWQGEEKEQGSG